MTNLNKVYKDFLEENFIANYEGLKHTLTTFPYYCTLNDIDNTNYTKINITKDSIKNETDTPELLDYLNNFVVDKENIYKYFFFSKTCFRISMNDYKETENDKLILTTDYLKYYVFHDGKKWIVHSPTYNDISSLLEKKPFEFNTLEELFNKYMSIYGFSLNSLDPKYNYVFGLTCFDTHLTFNTKNITKMTLLSMVEKNTNKLLPINLIQIKKICKYLAYDSEIKFPSRKAMMKYLDENRENNRIEIHNSSNYSYYIEFTHYKRFRRTLRDLINDPFKLVTINHHPLLFGELLTIFKGLNEYLKVYHVNISKIIKYFYNLYRDDKILKKTNLEYKKYDKEIIMKIHAVYVSSQIPIAERDIIHVLGALPKRKTDHLFTRL